MEHLQTHYIDQRLQAHFDNLNLPQTDTQLEIKDLITSLSAKGAIQKTEAPEEDNIFRWPFALEGKDNAPLYLTHCNLSFFYLHQGDKWEKRKPCLTMGLFATYCCNNEAPAALADEIIRIDTQLIPLWINDFANLHPLEMTDLAISHFISQCSKIRNLPTILDKYAASIYAVPVTEIRQTISRNKSIFQDYAFHLTWDEHEAHYKNTLNPPKLRKSDYHPYALTFEAFSLLAMRLHSPIAVKVHHGIIKTVTSQTPISELLKHHETL